MPDVKKVEWHTWDRLKKGNPYQSSGTSEPGAPFYFDGKIDEVRLSGVARSDAWIRLCHANQKSVDMLVFFE